MYLITCSPFVIFRNLLVVLPLLLTCVLKQHSVCVLGYQREYYLSTTVYTPIDTPITLGLNLGLPKRVIPTTKPHTGLTPHTPLGLHTVISIPRGGGGPLKKSIKKTINDVLDTLGLKSVKKAIINVLNKFNKVPNRGLIHNNTKAKKNNKKKKKKKSNKNNKSNKANNKNTSNTPNKSNKQSKSRVSSNVLSSSPTTSSTSRVMNELRAFLKSPPSGMRVTVGRDLTLWIIHLTLPPASAYPGETYKLRVKFPKSYPSDPPSLYFMKPTPAHEHVYTNGDICLSLLGSDWRPTLSAEALALSIMSMLSSAKGKSRPQDNAQHAGAKPGQRQDNWVYHDDSC